MHDWYKKELTHQTFGLNQMSSTNWVSLKTQHHHFIAITIIITIISLTLFHLTTIFTATTIVIVATLTLLHLQLPLFYGKMR